MYISAPNFECSGAVLVLHSMWGLNGFFRRLCDRFADQGFVALAPDLYDGRVADTVAEATKLRAKVTVSRKEPVYKYLIRMIGELRSEAGVDDIGVVGFSMGGHWAYWLAQRSNLPIAAMVAFYAARNGDYSESRSSFLVHFADTDAWVSPANVRKLERSLSKAGRSFVCHVYPGTGHWFFEDDRTDAYEPEAAALAWTRTIDFLKQELS